MSYLVVGALVALFLLGFRLFQIPAIARAAVGKTYEATSLLRDPAVDEEAKEAYLQKASISLFMKLGSMVLRITACALVSFLPLALAAWAGLASRRRSSRSFIPGR